LSNKPQSPLNLTLEIQWWGSGVRRLILGLSPSGDDQPIPVRNTWRHAGGVPSPQAIRSLGTRSTCLNPFPPTQLTTGSPLPRAGCQYGDAYSTNAAPRWFQRLVRRARADAFPNTLTGPSSTPPKDGTAPGGTDPQGIWNLTLNARILGRDKCDDPRGTDFPAHSWAPLPWAQCARRCLNPEGCGCRPCGFLI